MKSWRSGVGFVGLISFAGTATALLHRLGSAPWSRIDWRHLPMWVRITSAEDAVAALLRVMALGLSYWLLASVLLYAAAQASRVPGAAAAAGWLTLPVVRRVVDRAVAVALAASAAVAPAAHAAAGPSPTPPPVTVGVSNEGVLSPPSSDVPGSAPPRVEEGQQGAPSTSASVEPAPGPTLAPPIANPPSLEGDAGSAPGSHSSDQVETDESVSSQPEPPVEVDRQHVVAPGDNLWTIAAARLSQAKNISPSELTNEEIHAYWVRVIDANERALRSGNPNLIFPGERIALPPIRKAGG